MIRPPRFFATLVWVAALALALASTAPRAQLTIEIIGGGGTTVPIAIVPFAREANYPYPLTGIVGADLARSGLFKLIDPAGVNPRPARADDVRFGEWTARGADAVVVGSVTPQADGRVEVRFFLLDAVKQTQLAGFSYVVAPSQFRPTAHKIADIIYEKLTGDAGVFSTRNA
jgi:TolB protein